MIRQIHEENLLTGKKNVKTLVFLPQTGPEGNKLVREIAKEYEHNVVISLLRKHNLQLLASLLQKKESSILLVRGDTCTNVSWLYQYLTEAVALAQEKSPPNDQNDLDEVRVVTHELAAKGYHYCVRNSAFVEVKACPSFSGGDDGTGKTSSPAEDAATLDFSEDLNEKGDTESLSTFMSHRSDQANISLLLQNECVLQATHTRLSDTRKSNSLMRSTNVSLTLGEAADSPQTVWLVPYFLSHCESFDALVRLWRVPRESGRVQFLFFLNTDIADGVLCNLPFGDKTQHSSPSSLLTDRTQSKGETLSDEAHLCEQDYITQTNLKTFLPLSIFSNANKKHVPQHSMAYRRRVLALYADFRRSVELFMSSPCAAYQSSYLGTAVRGDGSNQEGSSVWQGDAAPPSSMVKMEHLVISIPTLSLFSRAGIPADVAQLFDRIEGDADSINHGVFASGEKKTDKKRLAESSYVMQFSEQLNHEFKKVRPVAESSPHALDEAITEARFDTALVATEADVQQRHLSHYLQHHSMARTLGQMQELKQLGRQEENQGTHTPTAGAVASRRETHSSCFPTPRLYVPQPFFIGALLAQDACVSDVYVLEFSPQLFEDLRVAYEKECDRADQSLGKRHHLIRKLSSVNSALENLWAALDALKLGNEQLFDNGCFAAFHALSQSPSFAARREAVRHVKQLLESMCPTRRAFVWDMTDDTVGCEPRFAFCLSYEHFLEKVRRDSLHPTKDPNAMRSRLDDTTSMEYALFHILFVFKEMGWFLIHQEDSTKWDKTERAIVRKASSDTEAALDTANAPKLLSSIKQLLAEEDIPPLTSRGGALVPLSAVGRRQKKPYLYTDVQGRRNSAAVWGAAVIPREEAEVLWEGVPVLLDSGEFGVVVDFRPVPAFLRDASARAEAGSSLRGTATPLYPTTSWANDEVLDDVFVPFQDWWLNERGRLRPTAAVPAHLCEAEQTRFPVVQLLGSTTEVLVLPTRVTELDVRYPTLCYVSSFEQQLQHNQMMGVIEEGEGESGPFSDLLYRPSLSSLAETPYGTQLRFVRLPLQTHYTETAASLFFGKAFFGDSFAHYENQLQAVARRALRQRQGMDGFADTPLDESFSRHFAALTPHKHRTAWHTPKRRGATLFPVEKPELFHNWYALHHYRRPHIVHDNAVFSHLGEACVSRSPWQTSRHLQAGSFHGRPKLLRCALASVPSLKSLKVKGFLSWTEMRRSV